MIRSFDEKISVIITGGGTGGHIYPALAIANEIKRRNKKNKILFIGSNGRMEMDIIPKYNFKIKGLWISGLKRPHFWTNVFFFGIPFLLQNLLLPIKLFSSIIKSFFIIHSFKPDIVIGFGGYASGPTLIASILNNTTSVIQEQNSFPGLTNRYLGSKVNSVFVAFENLNKYFTKNLFCYGNPIRSDLLNIKNLKENSYEFFSLNNKKKTILILGGSLGAKTMNESVLENLSLIKESDYQILWQTGKNYFDKISSQKNTFPSNIKFFSYISKMNYAYACSDIVISRSGALTISELCIVGKPVIFVPSPNVVADHQTKNAFYLKSINACEIVDDNCAKKELIKTAFEILGNSEKTQQLKKNIFSLAKPDATKKIVNKLFTLKND